MTATGTERADSATANLSEHAIVEIIDSRIKSGIYKPGVRIPSERMLSVEFGVSRRFVRMAFALLVERGVMEKSHYRRPFVALSGAPEAGVGDGSSSSVGVPSAIKTIAAVLPSHPKFPGGLSLVAGMHKMLVQLGSTSRLTFIDTFHEERAELLRIENAAIESLVEGGLSGLVWWSYNDDDQIVDTVRKLVNVPIVFIDRHPRAIDCDFVGIDDIESTRIVVEHLFSLNHRRIAHLMDPGNFTTIMERADGYRQAYRERGVPCSENLVFQLDWAENRIQKAFDHFFAQPDPPTALSTSNDFIAYEFTRYAESRGLRIPEDLSVVGHGNIDRYSARDFLTSIDQSFEMVGKSAAKLISKRIEDTASPRHSYQQIIVPSELVVRDSSRPL